MYDPTKSKEDTYSVTKLLRDEFSVKYPDVGLDITEATYNFDRAIFSGGSLPDEAGYELQTWYDQLGVSIMKGSSDDLIFADTYYRYFDFVTPPDYQKMIRAGAFTDLLPLLKEQLPDFDFSGV